MNKNYKHLNQAERIKIEKYLDKGYSARAIAGLIGRNPSTISRELKKSRKRSYSAHDSHLNYLYRLLDKNYGRSKIIDNKTLLKYVHTKLRKKWSPEQISLSLKKKYPNDKTMRVSHETIYFYIYLHSKKSLKEELIKNLRQKRKHRGTRFLDKVRDVKISDRVSIDERPEEVLGREIPGHWEGDLIIGKDHASAIGTLVERSTRAVILVHLENKQAETVRKAFEAEFRKLPTLMKKSLTYDNGTEMAQHKLFTKNTKVQVYFTHPYSPWERPTNENTNGLLRDYFPKGTDLSEHSKAYLKKVQRELNERPRKVLDGDSPAEVFKRMILDKIN
jgi:IS30 family transposase